MEIQKFHSQQAFLTFLENSPVLTEHKAFEYGLMGFHQAEESFKIEGYCAICEKTTRFLVDKQFGGIETEKGWLPNWRERLTCEGCELNNRQRAILQVIKSAIQACPHPTIKLYAMEQITPVFAWLAAQSAHYPEIECIGSEYLGDNIVGGSVHERLGLSVRHENAEALSFAEGSIDFVLSNDVLEHVNAPEQALREIYRVLKPTGELFLSIPFHPYAARTVRRAELTAQGVAYLLPPLYHGNPLSAEGSLVFHDFGWDFIEKAREIGFSEFALCYYWSYLYGHLGEVQYFFWGKKGF